MQIHVLDLARYPDVLRLLERTPGICLRDTDAVAATARFLERNPGLSFVAEDDGRVIGCAMCGHDGRRGYLQHVVVEPAYRGRGIATALVDRCLAGLERCGIARTHLDVLVSNEAGQRYWQRRGWLRRDDLVRFTHLAPGGGSR